MAELMKAKTLTSAIISSPIDLVWENVAKFTSIGNWILPTGVPPIQLVSQRLPSGPPEYAIGCVRVVTIGEASYCERLRGLCNHEHTLKYDLISYEGSTNPFPGSFLNNISTIRLKPVTVSASPLKDPGETYIEWSADFDTEAEAVSAMEATISGWIVNACKGLDLYCASQQASRQHPARLSATRPAIGQQQEEQYADPPQDQHSLRSSQNLSGWGVQHAGGGQTPRSSIHHWQSQTGYPSG